MDFSEIQRLKVGDKIAICVGNHYFDAIVVRPLFWNSDADEPDWEIETNNGFADVYSVYEVIKQ
jgi:hypothetical protein